MKKLIFSLAIVLAFFSFSAMQTDTKPVFKWVEETHDFGKVPQGKPVTVDVQFTNVGTEPLIISSVEPACGCTVAKFTATPIKKGQKGSITLTYNAAAAGAFIKATTVKSNATEPVKVIYIKGEVMAPSGTTTAPTAH